jgi:hypothetical protein
MTLALGLQSTLGFVIHDDSVRIIPVEVLFKDLF